ncbi:hypothetical protein C8R44DRAFT_739777 [Mycena epipterygia]|nr:hypothetical protein C8R44DRAFT_739777 [Mycena epipterygia]
MAAPASVTIADLSGKWSINKSLSDLAAIDKTLEAQGLGAPERAAVAAAEATLAFKHYKNADGVEQYDVEVVSDTRVQGVVMPGETRLLTWTDATMDSPIFGKLVVKTRRAKAAEIGDAYLTEGWSADTLEHGLIQSEAHSAGGINWTYNQTWGFEDVSGKRHHTRRGKFTGPTGQVIESRVVYDYVV